MWKQTTVNIGRVKAGVPLTITFEYEGEITMAKNGWGKPDIQVTCGCTSAVFNPSTKVLSVKYTPKSIPKHMKEEGKKEYPTRKTVMVKYFDETTEKKSVTLTFTGIVEE